MQLAQLAPHKPLPLPSTMGGICAKDESASSAVAPQYASDVEYRFARIIREQETLFNHLPVAELQSANVIKIVGHVGVFNTAPLADEGWLQGRMTNQESVISTCDTTIQPECGVEKN